MKKKRSYNTLRALYDLLFCLVLIFVIQYILAMIQINPITKAKDAPEPKAEFLITVTWPDNYQDDVDTYVKDPSENVVFFQAREEGLMHLDRDDLGRRNDRIITPNGVIEFKGNREIVTLRNITPGEFIVTVHMYHKVLAGREVPVTIELTKLNPYSIVARNEVILLKTGDEGLAFRFRVNPDGDVTKIDHRSAKIATKRSEENGGYTP